MAWHIWRRTRTFLMACGLCALLPIGARADLLEYVQKPEPHFAWKLKQKIENAAGVIYDLEMTSQTWEGIDWTHQLQIYQNLKLPVSARSLRDQPCPLPRQYAVWSDGIRSREFI